LSSSTPSDAGLPPPGDVIVGIGCYNDAATVGSPARAAAGALHRAGRRGRIVIADGGSSDQTVERAQEAIGARCDVTVIEYPRPGVDVLRAPYHGLEGRAAAIRAVLRDAQAAGAAACVFLDGKLTSATDEWLLGLLEPALAGSHDYVAPYYARHVFGGALTRSVVYPVFRALYGVRLRQPATGEFACSPRFMHDVLDEPFWDLDEARTAIDLWIASAAVSRRVRVCEVSAGVRTHAAAAEAPDLTTTVAQVVGGLFTDIEAHANTWHRIRGSAEVPCLGEPVSGEPAPPAIDVGQMIDGFRLGYRALREEWAWILHPKTVLRLKRLADAPADQFRMADEQWAEIVFDFALAHRARTIPRDHLLGCFTPLYLAWLAGFVAESRSGAAPDPEARLERLCLTFEMKKPYLIAGWRWPERFRA
jgi:hypothetical protein